MLTGISLTPSPPSPTATQSSGAPGSLGADYGKDRFRCVHHSVIT